MNRSKIIIAVIILCALFAQVLTSTVLADTNSSDIKMLSENKLPVGDVDGSGVVNSLDFAYMRMHLLGMLDDFKPEDDLWVSDVNGDDKFNINDLAFMSEFLLGMITEFPKLKIIERRETNLKPDLRIARIEPEEGFINQDTTFNVVVQNIGEDMVYGESLEITLSLEGSDSSISIIFLNPLAKNEYRNIKLNKQEYKSGWDFSQKGTYKLIATVDERNSLDEMDETNNSLSKDFYVEDDGNSMESATPIELGVKISGKMDYENDLDYFEFSTKESGMYLLESMGTTDLAVYLFTEKDENYPMRFYDEGNGNNFSARVELDANTTYYAKVFQKESAMPAAYEFSITMKDHEDDYGNDFESATVIRLNEKTDGQIEYIGDADYFSYTPSKRSNYEIEIRSLDGNYIHGNVYDSEGTCLYDTIDGSREAIIQMLLEENKTYFFKIENKDSNLVEYNISILEFLDDHGSNPENATSIGLGDHVTGSIDYAFDEDWFRLEISKSDMYRFETTGNTDTEGYLIDADGNELFYDDVSGDDYNFRIDQSIEGGKIYYIKVKHKMHEGTGSYGIRVIPLYDDLGDSIEFSEELKLYEEEYGTINYERDVDYFSFSPTSMGTYRIETSGMTDTTGIIYDSNGKEYADVTNDISSINLNFCTDIWMYTNTTYYICVKGNSPNEVGGYGIKIKRLFDE